MNGMLVGGIVVLAVGIGLLILGVLAYTLIMISIEEQKCTFSHGFVPDGPPRVEGGITIHDGKSKCGDPSFGVISVILGLGLATGGVVAIVKSRKSAVVRT